MELAARSLGANFWRALWHVTIPALRGSIAAAAVFSFLISFDEVVVAVFVGGPDATTLPKRMWESIRLRDRPDADGDLLPAYAGGRPGAPGGGGNETGRVTRKHALSAA